MRKLVLFVAVVCLISCYGMNAEAQTWTPTTGTVSAYHFVGPSKTAAGVLAITKGGAQGGRPGMNLMCQTFYGKTAHMCTVDEFFSTAGLAKSVTTMWAQPSLVNCVGDSASITCQEAGFAPGFGAISQLYSTCLEWTTVNAGYYPGGTAVQGSSNGWVTQNLANCSQPYPIACCAP